MGFGHTTTGSSHRVTQSTIEGGYDTTATRPGGGIIPGPWLCVEIYSELMLQISLQIEQTLKARPSIGPMPGGGTHTPFGDISFGIFGDIRIIGRSNQRCIPKKAADALVAAGEGCTSLTDQKYTAVSMGGNPTMVLPGGLQGVKATAGRLFTKFGPKRTVKEFVKYSPSGKDEIWKYWPNQWSQFPHSIGLPRGRPPAFDPSDPDGSVAGMVRWLKRNTGSGTWLPDDHLSDGFVFVPGGWWNTTKKPLLNVHNWNVPDTALFLVGIGNFNHNFNLDVGYKKTCGPAICHDCDAPDGTTTTPSNKECDKKEFTKQIPINITGTMTLEDWMKDQDSDTKRNGYLVFNDPYWSSGRAYPAPFEVLRDRRFDWIFDFSVGESVIRNPLVANEGPGYARYQGFGADIFEGNRDNDVSKDLHQIKRELKEALQNASAGWIGGLPVPESDIYGQDIFCGDLDLTDANIDQILRDFENQWRAQSLANDRAMEGPYQPGPPKPGGNVPGISEGY